MARASSWAGCLVVGTAEFGRRAMQEPSPTRLGKDGDTVLSHRPGLLPGCCRIASRCSRKPLSSTVMGHPRHANQARGAVDGAAGRRRLLPAFDWRLREENRLRKAPWLGVDRYGGATVAGRSKAGRPTAGKQTWACPGGKQVSLQPDAYTHLSAAGRRLAPSDPGTDT